MHRLQVCRLDRCLVLSYFILTKINSFFLLDEQALLKGCQMFGYVFHTRTPRSVTISAFDTDEEYEILNVIEFTSTRKRMSVIVRTPDNKIHLYCKVSVL